MKNGTSAAVKGKLKGQIENVTFEQDVELAPNESKDVTFTPDSSLNSSSPIRACGGPSRWASRIFIR